MEQHSKRVASLVGVGYKGPSHLELQDISSHRAYEAYLPDSISMNMGKSTRYLKRAMDITFSIAGLAAFALLLPIIYVIQKIDSPGPLFFTQTRIGINRRRFSSSKKSGLSEDRRHIVYPGKPFKIIKLRTMRVDAEAEGPQWAKLNDTRITRFGNFLRKSRLDEFPQFLNVLRSEMSVIGPRPERLCFIRQLENEVPHYHERLHVLPGITGLAQVVNGYDTDIESVKRKVELDRHYIAKAGIKSDFSILLMTARVLLTKYGAH